MSTEFQVGDEVRIIAKPPTNWLLGPHWISNMTAFCGQLDRVALVRSGYLDGTHYYLERFPCSWLGAWLEPVEIEPVDAWIDELEMLP